jgi:hypothetical protein
MTAPIGEGTLNRVRLAEAHVVVPSSKYSEWASPIGS